MAFPDDLTMVTVTHTIADAALRPLPGVVVATPTGRQWKQGEGSILPAEYTAPIEGGTWTLVLPAVDQFVNLEAYRIEERPTEGGKPWGRPYHIAPTLDHAPGPVDATDVITTPPRGGDIVFTAGPATDESMAQVAADPNSAFHSELTSTIATGVGQVVAPAITAALNDLDVANYDPAADYPAGSLVSYASRLWYALPHDPDTETVERVNLITNPRFAGGGEGWYARPGATATYQLGQVEHEYPTAVSGGNNLFSWATKAPALAGQSYAGSLDVTVPAGSPAIELLFSVGYGDLDSAVYTSPSTLRYTVNPGETVRVAHTSEAPAGVAGVGIRVQSAVIPAGARVIYSRPLLETGTAIRDYFDGATSPTAASTYAWTGVADASTSLETTLVLPTTERTNLITNPRFAGSAAGWQNRAGVGVTYRPGEVEHDYAAAVASGNTLFSWSDKTPAQEGQTFTGSLDVTVPPGSPAVDVLFSVGYGPLGSTAYTSPNAVRATIYPGETVRVVHTGTVPAGNEGAGIRVQAADIPAGAKVIYSRPLLEQSAQSGTYFDGSTLPTQGNVSYAWTGLPDASPSIEVTVQATRPTPGSDPSAWAAIRQDAPPVRPIGLFDASITPVDANSVPTWMDRTRTKTWYTGGSYLHESVDDGQTLTVVHQWEGMVTTAVREFGNGELMVVARPAADASQPAEIWVSEGYPTLGPDATWTPKVQPTVPHIRFTSAWSVYVHDNIGLAFEYGTKTGNHTPVGSGEFARYVHMTIDHGKTWRVVFDLADFIRKPTDEGMHGHGVAWDPYWDRIWVTWGDDENGTAYSDDLGQTWHIAQISHGSGVHEFQNVGILPMPDAILFGTDISPDGIHRIGRDQGKHTGTYIIQPAHKLNDSTSRHALCHGIFWTGQPGHPAFFAFGVESNPGRSAIVATRDGTHFETVWEHDTEQLPGRGLRGIVGPTIRGRLYSRMADADTYGNTWQMLAGPAPY